jgi:fucose 4-O-acetylase-like acetyltransferase
MRDQYSNRLDYLDSFRGLAIAMVVATHALGYARLGPEDAQLIGFLSRTIAVPVFFLVDGLLYALRHQEHEAFSYAAYVRKSARRLLLPWFVFTLLYCALRIAFEYMDDTAARVVDGQSWRDILLAAYLSSFSSQMYFLLSLFIIRMLSKVTHLLTCTGSLHRVVAAMLYIAIFHTLPLQSWFFSGLDPVYHAIWGMQFYLMGVALSRFTPLFTARGQWLSLITIGSGFLLASCLEGMLLYSQFLLLLGCYFLFFSNPKRFQFLSGLGRRSMGIYLLHIPLIMKALSFVLTRLLPPSTLVFFTLLTAATLCTSALLTGLILHHSFGRIVLGESPKPLSASASTV